MQRVGRFRFVILATIACAILFCVAAFSVSWAKWTGNTGSASAEVNGNSGLFYVEYPQYAAKNDDDIPIPSLDAKTYYLQVQKAGGISDYYAMPKNTNNTQKDERMVTNVYLKKGTVLDVYYGTAQNSIMSRNDGSASQFVHTGNSTAATATVTADGYYSFYFDTNWRTMYASYTAGNTGGGGGTTVTTPERDTTKYSVKVKFTDATVVFQLNHAINDTSTYTTYFHIWKEGGAGTTWPGLKMNTGVDVVCTPATASTGNSLELGISYSEVTGIILNCNSGDVTKKQTGDGATFFTTFFPSKLSANYTYTINVNNNVHWDNFTNGNTYNGQTIKNYISSVTATAPTGGSSTPSTPITPAEPDTMGATNPNVEIVDYKDIDVRKAVMSKTNNNDGTFTYQNYVCVSRVNSETVDTDNSLAFVVFQVLDENGNPITNSELKVKDIIIERAVTENDGVPTGSTVDVPPRLYGKENVKKLSDINFKKVNVETTGENDTRVSEYYDDGLYCILFFGDKEQQYFALDIKIVIEAQKNSENELITPPDFTIKATASNINHWQRYKKGYGEPHSFYLGGLINNVWAWDPRRTTHFTGTEITNAATQLSALNTYPDGSKSKYPIIPIDISLTVNLTKDSQVKAYMLGVSGFRYDAERDGDNKPEENVSYILPKEIVMPSALKDAFVANGTVYKSAPNFDLVIPVTGEYTFRFVGSVDMGTGVQLNTNGGLTDELGAGVSDYLGYSNYIVDKLYITTTATSGPYAVTFNSNGGSEVAAQSVKFGEKVSKPADPTKDKSSFVGWYSDTALNKAYNFDTPVTGPLNLYAKWEGEKYEITLVNTNTTAGTFNEDSIQTTSSGTLSAWPTFNTQNTAYTFDGWYPQNGLENEGNWGDQITLSTSFTGATEIYAKWTIKTYTVTFNTNGLPSSVTKPEDQTVDHGTNPTEPTLELPEHYTLDGWYSAATSGTKFNFNSSTGVKSNQNLYAHWHCDSGLYANGEYVKALSGDGTNYNGSAKYKVENVHLHAGDKLTFWNNGAQITTNVFVRTGEGATGANKISGTNYSNITVKSGCEGWYSIYYDPDHSTDKGLWIIYEGSYQDISLNENDGIYNGSTKKQGFTQSTDKPNLVVTSTNYTVGNDAETLTVRYNGADQSISSLKAGSHGTLTNGKIKLLKGSYKFEYNYADKILYVDGTVTNGLYVNDTYTATLTPYTENSLSKYKVERAFNANDKLTFAIDGKVVGPDFAFIRNSTTTGKSPAYSDVTGTSNTDIKIKTAGKYGFYIDVNDKLSNGTENGEKGIWADYIGWTITLNANGGTLTTTSTVTTDKSTKKLTSLPAAPSAPSGKAFDGWWTASSGGTQVTTNYTFTGDVAIYAHWKDAATDPNAGFTYESVSSSNGYVVGKFTKSGISSYDWNKGYRMSKNGNEYQIKRLYLSVGDSFKIRAGDYYSSGCNYIRGATGISNTSSYLSSSGNNDVTVNIAGYYDFYVSNGQNIWFVYSAT